MQYIYGAYFSSIIFNNPNKITRPQSSIFMTYTLIWSACFRNLTPASTASNALPPNHRLPALPAKYSLRLIDSHTIKFPMKKPFCWKGLNAISEALFNRFCNYFTYTTAGHLYLQHSSYCGRNICHICFSVGMPLLYIPTKK